MFQRLSVRRPRCMAALLPQPPVPAPQARPSPCSTRPHLGAGPSRRQVEAQAIEQPSQLEDAVLAQAGKLPSQAEALFNPTKPADEMIAGLPVAERESASDLDYLAVRP